jgi:BlaI family penicillinase repressor
MPPSKPIVPEISDAEWDVMKVVWDHPGPLTAGEVVAGVSSSRSWRPRTVKTLLNRLVKKGAVDMQADGSRFLYRARVTQAACVRHESRSFLARVFDGAVTPAVVHFLSTHKLSPDEIRELKSILDRGGKP